MGGVGGHRGRAAAPHFHPVQPLSGQWAGWGLKWGQGKPGGEKLMEKEEVSGEQMSSWAQGRPAEGEACVWVEKAAISQAVAGREQMF